jgi:vacuolar-type H+-ATPase subunit E/Vma4
VSDPLDRATALTALLPVRAALLAHAHEDADRAVHEARVDADAALARARDEARAAVDQARAEAETDAVTALAVDQGRARRRARSLVLAAQRAAYDDLVAAARDGVRALLDDEHWPRMSDALVRRVREALGPDAQVEPVADGVVGRAGERVLDLRLAALADAAVEALGPEVEGLWSS